MTKRKTWTMGLLLSLCALTGVGLTFAFDDQVKTQTPEKLLPANSVIYFQYDGSAKHKEAFEQTAAYEALYKSGLMDLFKNISMTLIDEGRKASLRSSSDKEKAEFEQNLTDAKALFSIVQEQGASFSVSLPEGNNGPPLPSATFVVKGIGKYEPKLKKGLQKTFGRDGIQIKTETIKGRKVSRFVIPDTPGVEAGWWAEGDHLVIVIGMNALNSAVDVAAGDAPNITTNPLYKKYVLKEVDFVRDSIGWFDFGALRKKFGNMQLPSPLPENEPKKINDLLTTLGLHNLGAIVTQSGYKGRAIWTETTLEAPGKRTGILAMSETKSFKLTDLPPLPEKTQAFFAGSVDYSKLYSEGIKLAINVAGYGPPRDANKLEDIIHGLPDIIGFDPQEELLDNLGSMTCLYNDPAQGMLGMGFGVAIEVKNPQKLRTGLNNILAQIKKLDRRDQLVISRSVKQGREVIHVYAKEAPVGPAFCVDDQWLIIGIVPQSVEAFLLRLDGKLNTWKPSEEHLKGLAELPQEYTSLTMSDPRQMYQTLFGIAPIYMGIAEMALRQEMHYKGKFPFKVSDLPPAELITKPLFPNFSVATVDEAGFHWTTRSSLPGIEGGSVATVAVVVALIIPAVQQAREAARRSTSKNNLKQLGLAMHNHHDVHKGFPEAAIPNKNLKEKQQLSFMVSLLPYLDQAPLYKAIDRKKSWDDKANKETLQSQLPVLWNPSQPSKPLTKDGFGSTTYVGIGGVGKDAPYLKSGHKRAGIFGYNRVTRLRDITDGASNTIMMSEANKNLGLWGRAGSATVRPLTKKPYINGPDGLGGYHVGGCHMLFADGRVRFISENIDNKTMESLSTIAGGEIIGEY